MFGCIFELFSCYCLDAFLIYVCMFAFAFDVACIIVAIGVSNVQGFGALHVCCALFGYTCFLLRSTCVCLHLCVYSCCV